MRIFGIVLFLLLPFTVIAADSAGNYAIWGVGKKSCHSYNLARAASEDGKYKDYLMGYFTAYNHIAQETYSITNDMDLDAIMTWVDDQCEMKPVISYEEVLTTFIIDHFEKRMKFPPGGFGRR